MHSTAQKYYAPRISEGVEAGEVFFPEHPEGSGWSAMKKVKTSFQLHSCFSWSIYRRACELGYLVLPFTAQPNVFKSSQRVRVARWCEMPLVLLRLRYVTVPGYYYY